MIILNYIDSFLNKTPMYKLVIYSLLSVTVLAFIESSLGILDYTPISLLISLVTITVLCLGMNFLFAKALHLSSQYESSIITALILFLILLPVDSLVPFYSVVIASFLATASKYILVYRNTHIFNPAAFGIYGVTFIGLGTAFWWVGSIYLLPLVLISGLLIVRKTRRHAMFIAGLIASFVGILLMSYFYQQNILELLKSTFISGPIIFFLTVMVTEPHTITKNRIQQIFYGAFIVLLPTLAMFTNFFTIQPELSLLIANLISFVISKRARLILKLKSVNKLSEDMFEYNFVDKENQNRKFNFQPGEFLEWNLPHEKEDTRGMRRYFTISSAPNTTEISIATKYPVANESSYKTKLKTLQIGETICATQLGGDFLLPNNKQKTIVQIAGGIGITPFISQIRDLLNKKQRRTLILFYCVKFAKDIVYVDLLKQAVKELDMKVICVVSDKNDELPIEDFHYESGYMSKEILQKYTERRTDTIYYISGPNMMVEMLKNILHTLNIKNKNIHTDYFPGF